MLFKHQFFTNRDLASFKPNWLTTQRRLCWRGSSKLWVPSEISLWVTFHNSVFGSVHFEYHAQNWTDEFTGSLILIWDWLILLLKTAFNFLFSELFPLVFENVAGSLLGSFNAVFYMLVKRRWVFFIFHSLIFLQQSLLYFWAKQEA